MHLKEIEMENFKSFGRKVTVPFLQGYTAITGPNGSGKCVAGDTRVWLPDGEERTIAGLVEHALRHGDVVDQFDDGVAAYENPEDVEVLTLDPRTLTFDRSPVIAFVKREAPDSLLRIRTRSGRRIQATPYHPLFALHDGHVVCPRADELAVGQAIAAYVPPPAAFVERFEERDVGGGDSLVVVRDAHGSWASGVLWDEIEEVDWVTPPERWVYDLSVLGTHNFVAEGLVAHNSNIADAILFVLGPRSGKAIRAGKLTDLIWNGGQEKKGATHTEVSLLFDNRDRVIPIESDDVKLTRRVLLSPSVEGGYNSYFYVNDRKSQLQEFDQLLAHARISAEGYNLVQQGDIQRIVQMSAVDRRRILDDIAGITKFDEDIQAAEGKRSAAEDNLERIRIILQEIEKHLKQLESDRGSALKYKELKGKLDLAKAQLAYKNKSLIEESITGANEQLAKHELDRGTLEEQKAGLLGELEAATRKLEEMEAKIAERGGEEARQLQERLNGFRIERATTQNEVEKAREALKQLKLEGSDLGKERVRQQKEIDGVERERTGLSKRHAEVTKDLEKAEGELGEVDAFAAKSDAKVLALQRDIVALNGQVDELEEKVRALTLEADRHGDAIDRLSAEVTQLEGARKSYALELADTEFQIGEMKGDTKDATKSGRKLQEDFYAKRKEEAELAKETLELEQAILGLTREYERLKAESEVASALAKGYTRAVAAILDARDRGAIKGVHGTVAELAKANRRFEVAMNVAAGNRMQAVVVDTDVVAAECIEFLKKGRAGRATFLPLSKMLSARPRGKAVMAAKETLGFAIDLIEFGEKYRDAFYYVFGDTLVVETLDQARALMGGIRMVTLGGELIEASGAMIGGELERSPVGFGGVSRGDLDKVASELRKATEQADKARARLAAVRTELTTIEGHLREVGAATGTTEVKLDALEAQRKEFAAKVKATDDDLKSKQQRLADLRKTADRTSQDLSRLGKRLDELKGQRDGRKKEAIDATPQQVAARMKQLAATKAELQEEFHALGAKLETFEAQLKMFRDRLSEIDARLAANKQGLEATAANIAEFTSRLEDFEKEIRGLEKMTANADREVREFQTGRDEAYKEKTNLEAAIDKVAQKVEAKDAMFLAIRQTLLEQEAKLKQAEEELAAVQIEVKGDLPSLETLKRTIVESEAQVNALGNVNLRALEDYEEQQKRHDGLGEEFKQLETQRTDLLKLVDELNGKKKEGLVKVFAAINENFKRVYAELSEGGEAELVLENELDPLQGGLIMRAKPPHKKVLRLEALSGGEKSLVSMAFIVAIQQYDPSPFYLLDEVDQNLDAVNAEKVARMIRRNSHAAQFVQISLRKVTLKQADHIAGVTMRSDGISELVMKVNLADIHEEKASEEVPA